MITALGIALVFAIGSVASLVLISLLIEAQMQELRDRIKKLEEGQK